ncbi:MAG: alpha-glucan family phosphorylase [Ilumatobacter sp.]|uniref:alpha-glucan family phosphorylase n=1 Tax=Ilumatobacter sp. TaxID=1967498 RepID=UPI00391A6235
MSDRDLRVAYFCMEYGLHDDLKLYAGGLGILAGDYLKGAHDTGRPIIGIGIKWKQGYTDQYVNDDGRPYDSYTTRTYDLVDTGVTVTVTIRERPVLVKVWRTEAYGNSTLYLLDTDVDGNADADRWICGQLYGWFAEERLAQEIVLGIGGVRALRALGVDVDVYHFNEGHAVLAALELIAERRAAGASFDEARRTTRDEVVFTTHTPVIQGNESHDLDTMEYVGAFHGLSRDQMIGIGGDPFNMTVAALRLARKSNAVAQLHAETANQMWGHVEGRSQIVGITNCIHRPTWVDDRIVDAWRNERPLRPVHDEIKAELLAFVETRAGVTLRQDRLLIGFSRRAAPYKRSDLIFSDLERIEPYLRDGRIQIVFSGKAHPLDDTGKDIVANLVTMMRNYPAGVVFLENYGMEIGRMLTRGSDVWLNNPRRPQEASGTSGMKAAMNGVLNCSILDGWWPEACEHGVNGWQIGDGFESDDVAELDAHDRDALYRVLLDEVLPTYENDSERWESMMRSSIESTWESFAVERMLDDYERMLYRTDPA